MHGFDMLVANALFKVTERNSNFDDEGGNNNKVGKQLYKAWTKTFIQKVCLQLCQFLGSLKGVNFKLCILSIFHHNKINQLRIEKKEITPLHKEWPK